MAPSTSASNSTVQDCIFHAEAAPACKKLVWLACNEELEVRSLLFAKGSVENDTCPCCGKDSETTMHALLQCEEAKRIWFGSPLGLRVELLHDITTVAEWIGECASFMDKKSMGMVCMITWALWEKRNVWVKQSKKLYFSQVMAKARSMFVPDEWVLPSYPHVKANFSASVEDEVGTAMGVVFRDFVGEPQASATNLMEKQCFEKGIDSAMCYRWALEKAWELGFCDVIFETDCEQLYSHWNEVIRGKANSDGCFLDSLLEDCKTMVQRTRSCLKLVGCGGNRVAQCIASEAFVYGERVWTEEVMDEATQYLLADVLAPLSLEYSDSDSDSFHDF